MLSFQSISALSSLLVFPKRSLYLCLFPWFYTFVCFLDFSSTTRQHIYMVGSCGHQGLCLQIHRTLTSGKKGFEIATPPRAQQEATDPGAQFFWKKSISRVPIWRINFELNTHVMANYNIILSTDMRGWVLSSHSPSAVLQSTSNHHREPLHKSYTLVYVW